MIDGPWEMSGPEEGDKVDRRVFVAHSDADGYEVIEITKGTLAQKKAAARQIADLLNTYEGRLTP
jgi:hypothetical protein